MEFLAKQLHRNLFYKTISTERRNQSYDYFSQSLSTAILKNEHSQMIVCGPRKVGKLRMVRHVVENLVRIHENGVINSDAMHGDSRLSSHALVENGGSSAKPHHSHFDNAPGDGAKTVKVVWIDSVEKQAELLEIIQSALITWIRMHARGPGSQHTQEKEYRMEEKGSSARGRGGKKGKRGGSRGRSSEKQAPEALQTLALNPKDSRTEEVTRKDYRDIATEGSTPVTQGTSSVNLYDEVMTEVLKEDFMEVESDEDERMENQGNRISQSNLAPDTNMLGNQYDIISDEQLGKLEVLMTAVTMNYGIYPIFVFRHFDRVCKLANKFIYHLLDLMHTTKAAFAIVGISQSINLHTILDKGTGTTGKLGGTIGSYTRIKSRLYSGRFILVRTFQNESEIAEAILSLLDVTDSSPDATPEEISAFSSSLRSSLSQPQILQPLLLNPDCSTLIHVCRSVIRRLEERNSLIVTLMDWSEAINQWFQNDQRLRHIESFSNQELCMLLASRDVEEKILTPSQENNSFEQRTEIKEEWFSFTHVYTQFLNIIARTANQDIKDEYADQGHMIPDITTNRASCQAAYRTLFERGYLKRFSTATVVEDSKARFHQLHPQEIRSFILRHSDKFHTSIVSWAESRA